MAEKTEPVKSRKKLIIIIVVIAAVAAAGLIGYIQINSLAQQTGVVIPETVVLSKTNLESKVTASGNFSSTDPVTVGSNIQGAEVDRVFVEEGSRVYEGDVLAILKTSEIERGIADAEAAIAEIRRTESQQRESAQRALDQANDQYNADNRQTQDTVNAAQNALNAANVNYSQAETAFLNGDPSVTQDDLDKLQAIINEAAGALSQAQTARENALRAANNRRVEAQASLDALSGADSARQQRSQLETLRENLANSSITSPITGIVTQVNTEAGMAAIGTMFIVENTETLQITASVAEFDVVKIETGMRAHVTSNATGDTVYDGEVDFIAPVASDLSGSFEIKVLVTSPIGLLKPGMTATVEIVTAYKDDVFAVPIDAVVTLPDGKKVVYAFEPGAGSMVIGGGPPSGGTAPEGSGGGPVFVGREIGGADAGAGGADRREIVVKTGMETDFFIEIISDELREGMLILSDPMGLNVPVMGGPGMMMMGAAPVSQTVQVDEGGGGAVMYGSGSAVGP